MTHPTDDSLKPCPFCGAGTTEITPNGRMWTGMKYSEPSSVSVRHWCEAVPGQPSRMLERVGRDKASAIEAWNARALLAEQARTDGAISRDSFSGEQLRAAYEVSTARGYSPEGSEAGIPSTPAAGNFAEWARVWHDTASAIATIAGGDPNLDPKGMIESVQNAAQPLKAEQAKDAAEDAPDLTKLDELAKAYAAIYYSPHHFTMSVNGLREIIRAARAAERKA